LYFRAFTRGNFKIISPVIFFIGLICSANVSQPGFCAGEPQSAQSKAEGRLITISQGIKQVLKDSRLIKISLAGKEMAFQDSMSARSAFLPRLSASISQTFLDNEPKSKFGLSEVPTAQKDSLAYGFEVYQTLYDFGKSFANFKAARELVNASQANFEAVKKAAVLEFVLAYFDLLEAIKMIEVSDKEIESLQAYLLDVEQLFEQGVVVKNDLLPVRVKMADARQRLIVSRNLKEMSEARIKNILTVPLKDDIRVVDVDMDDPRIPELSQAWEIAGSLRSEIIILNQQIKAAALAERAKAIENFPTVFVDGGYSYTQNKYQVHQDDVFVRLGAKADLYEGGSDRAALHKERDRRNLLTEQRNKVSEDIGLEVQSAYLGLTNAKEKVSVSRGALEQAEENVRASRAKYNEGAATNTEVLEAIALQTNAQTNYYRANYEVRRNFSRVLYAMGIDLELMFDRMNKEPVYEFRK
jgi:outer membrane protein